MTQLFSRMFWLLLSFGFICGCSSDERAPGQWPLSRAELERGSAPDDPAAGTYRRYCIGCHGVDGRGNGGLTGADFTQPNGALAMKDDETLIASVRDGRRGERATMPAHRPVLSDAQIRAVVAYVRKRYAPAPRAAETTIDSTH